ncbi:hypothetical protein EIP86_002777 [Pleurotus ostreatoroseus]|nr:hypothetical protein EIP86_002777 [Pleurotus ostreatoroseus]
MHLVGTTTQPPLSSIAERRSGSGEESEEDEEDEDGGWRAETLEQARGSHDETVLMSGYLWKKGERRKTWKKRWFVLRPAHLAFYKTSAEYKLLRLLDLSDIHSCTPVQLKKHTNVFGLVSPTRTFYLQAGSAQEVANWVKAVSEARQALLDTSTDNSGTAPIPIPASSSGARSSYQVAPSPSFSHSPYNHHLTSSESEDGLPSMPRSHGGTIAQSASETVASPSKQPGPIDPSKVIITGYLMKCGSRRHIWHNRWFTLSGDKLVYSRSHMDTKPHRSIPLAQMLDALEYDLPTPRHNSISPPLSPPRQPEHVDGLDTGDAGKHTFKIVTTKRTLLLCAPSEEEEIKWLSAVRALIARRSAVPGDSAAASPASVAGPGARSTGPAAAPAASSDQGHPTATSALPGTPGASAPVTIGGATSPARRRDSIARRLSLSTSGGAAHTAAAPPAAGTGVTQEASI